MDESQQSYMHAEDPAVTHQDANIPRGRSRESVRRDDDFSPPTTDQPEHTPSHNLSVDQVKTNTISAADDHVSVKEEEISHSEKEPELESRCLSQDCVATTCDVTPPEMDSVAGTSCARLSSKPTINDECLLSASCQTQDSGFADAGIKSATSDVGENSGTVDEAEEKSYSEKELQIRHRLQHQGIVLENMELTQDGSATVGTILQLVLNECYGKKVAVRHSANEWKTFDDTSAEWLETVEGGAVDRFKFHFELPKGQFSL